MPVRTEQRTRFADELRRVPAWAWVSAGIAFVAVHVVFIWLMAHDPKAPALWVRILMAIGAGSLLGCYFLLIGYINQDAGRRGMSRLAWTLLAVFVPNGLGIILYFILRQPLSCACPQCSNIVQKGFNFCPRCNYKLGASCPQCQRVIGISDAYCPYCGTSLRNPAGPAPGLPTQAPG